MPTVKQYMETIPDPDIRARALRNMHKERELDQCKSLEHAVFTGMLWHRTPELYEYWAAVHHNIKYPNDLMAVPAVGTKNKKAKAV